MIFPSKVSGIPCQVRIRDFSRAVPERAYGMGGADPPEPAAVSFEVLDRKGYKAPWLSAKMDEADSSRIEEECFIMLEGELYG